MPRRPARYSIGLAAVNDADKERVGIALKYYIERVNWASHDKEREEFKRLLKETISKEKA